MCSARVQRRNCFAEARAVSPSRAPGRRSRRKLRAFGAVHRLGHFSLYDLRTAGGEPLSLPKPCGKVRRPVPRFGKGFGRGRRTPPVAPPCSRRVWCELPLYRSVYFDSSTAGMGHSCCGGARRADRGRRHMDLVKSPFNWASDALKYQKIAKTLVVVCQYRQCCAPSFRNG